jgi:hypothetical protein
MSFHSRSLIEDISLGHSPTAVKVFKGELSDEEVVSYIKILNEDKKGLNLILEDKNISSRNDNLWIQLKETTGFQPGTLSNILNEVVEIESMDEIDCRSEIRRLCQEKYDEKHKSIFDAITVFYTGNIVSDNLEGHNSFVNFLLSASQSYHSNMSLNPSSPPEFWDYRFIVCEDLQDTKKNIEGIPLANPKALSKPVADAMFQVD